MIRTTDERWLWEKGRLLYLFLNQSLNHKFHDFSSVRCAAMSIISYLSYCVVDKEEKSQVSRSTIIPSLTFQKIIKNEIVIDIRSVLLAMDFPEPIIIRTRRFVALGLEANKQLFVGIRGTVGAYDWSVNLSCLPRSSRILDIPLHIHGGFLSEAEDLIQKLVPEINARHPHITAITFAGHSLGGAISAILHQSRSVYKQSYPLDGDCYIFGAPRIAWRFARGFISQPFALRRPEDIVPRVPPALLGFESFEDERNFQGEKFSDRGLADLLPFVMWLEAMAFAKFIDGHSIENYRVEALRSATSHPDIARYVKNEVFD